MPATRRSSTATADPAVADGGTGIVCPFCAHVRADAVGACPRCTMQDTPSTRRNTGERIGPWFVLQRKNPTAPGLRFNVILALARRGHVTARSIVRGPTTGQLWRYASDVKGLSRLFGSCWHCHAELSTEATSCSRCKSAQEPPDDPDAFLEGQAELPLMETAARVSLDEPAPAKPAPAPLVEPALSTALDDAAIDPPARSRPRPEPRDAGLARVTPTEPARPNRRATTAIDPMLSVSELAAAFQVPAPPRATLTRRVGRGLWKTAKVTSVLVLLTAAAGAVVFTVKPEWRDPARAAVEPYAFASRDAALRAGAWSKAAWHDAWNAGARTLARFNEPPASVPNVDATSPNATSPGATPAADPAADALPPATPIRPDPSAPSARPEAIRPEAKRPETPRVEAERPEVPPGATSIADVTPPAAPSPRPAAAPSDASWDALMGAPGAAATRPADDRAIVANARPTPTIPANAADATARVDPSAKLDPSAEGGTPPPSAPVDPTSPADAATTLPADPEMRAAQLDDQTGALLREADRVLAEARAADAARRPTQATPPAAATPPPAATPNVAGSGTVASSGGVSTGQSSQTVDPSAPRPAATPAPKPAAPAPAVSLDQAMAQAATLRQKAFDAEARRDWPAALKFWEQIAALPDDARPSDVIVRLKIAQDRVKR